MTVSLSHPSIDGWMDQKLVITECCITSMDRSMIDWLMSNTEQYASTVTIMTSSCISSASYTPTALFILPTTTTSNKHRGMESP